MRRIASLVALLLVPPFALAAPAPAAQDEATGVGTEVVYVDAEGNERGTVTVTEVADPFAEFDPARPPEAGARYVLLTVAFENTGRQPFEANPNHLLLQDADGYLWDPTSIRRLEEDVVIPELQSQQMAPGNRVSGVVGFVLPEEAALDNVFYQPERGRLILLADLRPEPGPTVGTEVPYVDADGGEALVTVTEVADPFAGFDPGRPPEAGSRYVMLDVAFENTGERPFEADPGDLVLRDADGFLWRPANIARPPDAAIPALESQRMAPGNRVSGVVGFQVPAGAELTGVHYQPESGRLVLLADLTAGAATPTAGAAGTPTAATPRAASQALTAADCEGVEDWLLATVGRLERVAEMVQEASALEDVAALAPLATEFAELAEAQRAAPVPPPAEEANEALADVLDAFAGALTRIAGGEDPDEDLLTELTAVTEMQGILEQLDQLATDCGIEI